MSATSKSRVKMWCYTVNNYDEDTDMIDIDLVKYICVGKEVSASGTPHLQGFVIFKEAKTLAHCKEILPTAHWAVKYRNSNPPQAANYCKKDGDFFEWGECPQFNTGAAEGGEKTKANYQLAWEQAKLGQFEEMDKSLLFRHYHTCKRILQDYQNRATDLTQVCGIWLVGTPDSGKSHIARHIFGEAGFYDKPANKWFDGYQREMGDTIIVDDVDHAHRVLGHHLKRWGDKYSFPGEQKGTTIQVRPKRVIVTSNYKIEEIWAGDSQMIEALEKRYIQYVYTSKWWEYKDPEVIDRRIKPPPGFVPRAHGPEMDRLRTFYGMMPTHLEIQANAVAVAKSLSPPRQVPLLQIVEEAGELALLDPQPDTADVFLTPCCNRQVEHCCQWDILEDPSMELEEKEVSEDLQSTLEYSSALTDNSSEESTDDDTEEFYKDFRDSSALLMNDIQNKAPATTNLGGRAKSPEPTSEDSYESSEDSDLAELVLKRFGFRAAARSPRTARKK